MSVTATHSQLAGQLPADAYHHLIRSLVPALPPPGENPGPEDIRRRDHAAIAAIAALAPANAAEAELAAQFVAASAQWRVCLRLAQAPGTPPPMARTSHAQSASMMRQANAALRLLSRMQEVRRKLEADDAARDRIAWTEHCAIGLMAAALSPAPAAPSDAIPESVEPAAPHPEPAVELSPEPAEPSATEPLDAASKAEEYAALYPERAALVRRTGRVPADASFGPPDDDVLQALLTARTPALAALDQAFREARAA